VAIAFYDRRAPCPNDKSILPADVGRMNFCIDVSLQAYKDALSGSSTRMSRGSLNCRAGRWFLGEKHRNSLTQSPGTERRGERRQHCEAVFLANLPYRSHDGRLARADGENLAAELPAHEDFKNFAGLDAIDRESENDEIRKLGPEYRPQFIGFRAFAGYEAEIFKYVGQECPKVLLAVRDAGTGRHLSSSESRASRQIVVEHRICNSLISSHSGNVKPRRKNKNLCKIVRFN
jgi:hypothetical protein